MGEKSPKNIKKAKKQKTDKKAAVTASRQAPPSDLKPKSR